MHSLGGAVPVRPSFPKSRTGSQRNSSRSYSFVCCLQCNQQIAVERAELVPAESRPGHFRFHPSTRETGFQVGRVSEHLRGSNLEPIYDNELLNLGGSRPGQSDCEPSMSIHPITAAIRDRGARRREERIACARMHPFFACSCNPQWRIQSGGPSGNLLDVVDLDQTHPGRPGLAGDDGGVKARRQYRDDRRLGRCSRCDVEGL